jgi:hypothetical protein
LLGIIQLTQRLLPACCSINERGVHKNKAAELWSIRTPEST